MRKDPVAAVMDPETGILQTPDGKTFVKQHAESDEDFVRRVLEALGYKVHW